jgi:hypothetical protein
MSNTSCEGLIIYVHKFNFTIERPCELKLSSVIKFSCRNVQFCTQMRYVDFDIAKNFTRFLICQD